MEMDGGSVEAVRLPVLGGGNLKKHIHGKCNPIINSLCFSSDVLRNIRRVILHKVEHCAHGAGCQC